MELVAFDPAFGEFLVGDSNSFLILGLVEPGMHLQAFAGGGASNQLDDDFKGFQWFALPVACDMTEQAMFDLVPLAGARRVMTNLDHQAGAVGEALKLKPAKFHGDWNYALLPARKKT